MLDPFSNIPMNISRDLLVPKQVRNKLKILGAEIVLLNSSFMNIPSCLWKYLVADDSRVKYFMVRNNDRRISEKDNLLTQDWLNRTTNRDGGNAVFCVRHNQSTDLSKPFVPGLFGAHRSIFNNTLGGVKRVTTLIANLTKLGVFDSLQKMNDTENYFLNSVLWPMVKNMTLCYDDIKGDSMANFVQSPMSVLKLNDSMPLSTVYNEFDEVSSQ